MLGAIIGSLMWVEWQVEREWTEDIALLNTDSPEAEWLTEATTSTVAIAKAILECKGDLSNLEQKALEFLVKFGFDYFDLQGTQPNYQDWLTMNKAAKLSDLKLCNEYWNLPAARVSPCGFIATSIEEAISLSQAVTKLTHDLPEEMRAAEAVAVAIFLAKSGKSMAEIKKYLRNNYYTCSIYKDNIRRYEVVVESFEAFFKSNSFVDAIQNTMTLGNTWSDAVAAATGGIAEAYYGIPSVLREHSLRILDLTGKRMCKHNSLSAVVQNFEAKYGLISERMKTM